MTTDSHAPVVGRRTRDPQRREKILAAAAKLMGNRGYNAVSMAEIGKEAGITGSGIYRHFDSKSTILVELYDQIIDDLLADQKVILDSQGPADLMLGRLIDGQVSFVVDNHEFARLYHGEVQSFPEEDRGRLRRKQRLYLEEWVHLVREGELYRGLSDAEARTLVHAAVGAIQSPLFHHVGLEIELLRMHLTRCARLILGVPLDVDTGR